MSLRSLGMNLSLRLGRHLGHDVVVALLQQPEDLPVPVLNALLERRDSGPVVGAQLSARARPPSLVRSWSAEEKA